jgi:flagellar protein FliO/FliZ
MKPVSRLRLITYLTVFLFLQVKSALSATEPDPTFSASLRLVWGLLVVLGILFIIYGLMKKKMPFLHMPEKGIIKIVEVRHLLPKKSLYLVEVRGQEFLLGAGHDRIDLIAAIDQKPKGSFAEILDRSEAEIPL